MTTTTATWPTPAEFGRAATLLADAANALDELQLTTCTFSEEVTNRLGTDPLPTLEQVGRMSWLVASAAMGIDQMQKHLEGVRAARDTAALFGSVTQG